MSNSYVCTAFGRGCEKLTGEARTSLKMPPGLKNDRDYIISIN